MNCPPNLDIESQFIPTYLPVFLQRFGMEYYREELCIEFFVNERLTGCPISSSIVLSYNASQNDLHVSRFHPELYLEPNSKYMSAVCFYLVIQHSAASFAVSHACHISLETVPLIFDGFYKKLKDFDFHIDRYGLGSVVELVSDINRHSMDTGIITKHTYNPGEIPFMK
jgi:hypothetical protein